jgi:hypothetical protein
MSRSAREVKLPARKARLPANVLPIDVLPLNPSYKAGLIGSWRLIRPKRGMANDG